ncbi:MAG: phage tail tip lysozyme [Archangium sp.]
MSTINRTNSGDSILRAQRQIETTDRARTRVPETGFERNSQFARDEGRELRNRQEILGARRSDEVSEQLQAEQQAPQEDNVHTVVPGDTLWAIARANGVPLQQLIEANPQIQNPDLIFPGQRINIPAGGTRPPSGDTQPPPTAGAEPPTAGAEPPAEGAGEVTGADAIGPNSTLNERAQAAMRYFESQGWTKEQAAGIVANLIYESGGQLNHRQAQIGGGPGYGLAQWENPRQADFRRVMGVDIRESTFEQQLAFVQWELTNTESRAGNALRGATTAADAANVFLRQFERPRDPDASQAERTRLAQRLFSGQSI